MGRIVTPVIPSHEMSGTVAGIAASPASPSAIRLCWMPGFAEQDRRLVGIRGRTALFGWRLLGRRQKPLIVVRLRPPPVQWLWARN
jgi:hypothetical protein